MKILKLKIKTIVFYLVSLLPFKFVRKLANRNLLVINYHSILGVDSDAVINENTYRTAQQFEEDILYLKKNFQFVTLVDIIESKKNGKPLPKNSVYLTFDDGLSVVYDIFRPILLKYDISASFFINPTFVDNKELHYQRKKNLIEERVTEAQIDSNRSRWEAFFTEVRIQDGDFKTSLSQVNYAQSHILNEMLQLFEIDVSEYLSEQSIYLSTEEINEMISEGFTFGGHSMDHPKYDELSLNEQYEQTCKSIKWVKEKFRLDYSVFAFPLRDHDISMELFDRIKPFSDITFGVIGVGDDVIPNHIQRIDVESTGLKISIVLKFEYFKFILLRLMGRKKYQRPTHFKK
ncbi:polysaccharide deacetylase family protein [Labilibacter marinus]|uniref:polysaccharide deacetylase family protein n=1 Tax=Labilibacter marinus TaxID=1477105 RepID=UPI0008294ED5|nr:polysaccharide deacetylase family protein [Labilibacter marinus]